MARDTEARTGSSFSQDFFVPKDFRQLVNGCISFCDKTGTHKYFRKKRQRLAEFVEKFHRECGTLNEVQDKIDLVRHQECTFLMTAHQPNLFAYSGVLRKATLIHSLSRELERRLKAPVASFFGIADQDFTHDRWVKSTLLPAVQRKDGTLTLQTSLPREKRIKEVPNPTRDMTEEWRDQVSDWLERTLNVVTNSLKTERTGKWPNRRTNLRKNLGALWGTVEKARKRSSTYADFNAFFMSRIVNKVWGYNTLFARFSECQQILSPEFEFLISHSREYSKALEEVHSVSIKEKGRAAVSETESELVPFWYHCNCGGKSRLHLERHNGYLVGTGSCASCHNEYRIDLGTEENPDLSLIADRISARAISMTLVFFKGLGVSCYVGGIGGRDYLTEASYVANKLNIPFPPIAFWRPHDRYLGISQLEAFLQFKRITGNLDITKWETEVDRLKERIAGIYSRIDELEVEKEKLVRHLGKGDPAQRRDLQERIRKISRKQGRMKGKTNLSVLNRDLKMLKNVPVTLDLIPSIIDYAINIGLKETSEQWMQFLREDGRLFTDLYLKSFLEDITELKPFASIMTNRIAG